MRSSLLLILAFSICTGLSTSCKKSNNEVQTQIVDFELLQVPTAGYWNGSDGSGSFKAGILKFENQYSKSWGTWAGFAYSQKNDVTTTGFTNEFSVFDASNKQNKFAVFYPSFEQSIFVSFPAGEEHLIQSMDMCNNSYAGLAMKNGDSYSKKFGGTSGKDKDWFKVTINGFDKNGIKLKSQDVFLADYWFSDASKAYILSNWTTFDLSSLGKVNKLTFVFSSSDNGIYGINTPTYVCLDNIRYVEEQTAL